MDKELSPLEEAMLARAERGEDPTEDNPIRRERHARTVGYIDHRPAGHMPAGLAGALIAGLMVHEIQKASIFREEPLRYTDPIKDAAHADAVRREIDTHQTRMQAAEDKRVRKAEKLRKSNVQHQDKK